MFQIKGEGALLEFGYRMTYHAILLKLICIYVYDLAYSIKGEVLCQGN